MKTVILIAILAGFVSEFAHAQLTRPPLTKQKMNPVKASTVPAQTSTLVYSLTSAKVSIKTGNDNKEFPSMIYVELWLKDNPSNNYNLYCLYNVGNLKNEMASNSITELGLGKTNGESSKFLLSNIQKNGLKLTVSYLPNFFMDAWRIENINCTLEFRDQNGNLHPTMGSKTISFSNATGFLNNEYHVMLCPTDQNLGPLAASIEK